VRDDGSDSDCEKARDAGRPGRRGAGAPAAPRRIITTNDSFPGLNADCANVVFDFLASDAPALGAMLRVSKDMCAAVHRRAEAVPAGLLAAAAARGFPRLRSLHLADAAWCDDDLLRWAASADGPPQLASVDVSGCQAVKSLGIKALVKGLGPRLKRFVQRSTARFQRASEARVTKATLAALAGATGLEEVALTIRHLEPGDTLLLSSLVAL
jgi:hypothetical protein